MKPLDELKSIKPLLGGQVLSIFGDRLALVALIELLSIETSRFKTQGSIFELSKLSLAMMLPSLLLAPLVGTYVDRMSRKKTLIASDLLRGFIVILIPLLHSFIPLWGIYLLVALMSLINLFFLPARCAIVPQLVETSKIPKANSLLTIGATLATIIGFALGGIVASKIGWRIALVIDGFTFFASAAFMIMLKPIFELPRHTDGTTSWKILREGIVEIRQSKQSSLAIISTALIGCASASAYILGVPILQRALEQATIWIGIAVALGALGIAFGCYLVASKKPATDQTKTLGIYSLIAIALLAVPVITPNRLLVSTSVFIAGFAAGPVLVLSETILQKEVSLNRQATAFATRDVFLKASIVATSLLVPILAIRIGNLTTILILLGLLATILLMSLRKRLR